MNSADEDVESAEPAWLSDVVTVCEASLSSCLRFCFTVSSDDSKANNQTGEYGTKKLLSISLC